MKFVRIMHALLLLALTTSLLSQQVRRIEKLWVVNQAPATISAPFKEKQNNKIKCRACTKTFSHNSSFKYHWDTQHAPQVLRWKCPDCPRLYVSHIGARRHFERAHQNKSFPCPQCKKLFSRTFNVRRHMTGCTGTAPSSQPTPPLLPTAEQSEQDSHEERQLLPTQDRLPSPLSMHSAVPLIPTQDIFAQAVLSLSTYLLLLQSLTQGFSSSLGYLPAWSTTPSTSPAYQAAPKPSLPHIADREPRGGESAHRFTGAP